MQMATSSSRTLTRLFVLCSAVSTSLLLAACGDDGTEGLASCPDYKIRANKMGVQECVPRAGAGGAMAGTGGTGGTPAAPRAGGGSNSQQPPNKPAAGSGGAPAANGGTGVPPIPKGGTWACVQVASTCSCQMAEPARDSCTKPLPSCCVLIRSGEGYDGCVCYAESNVACTSAKQDPMNYVMVSTCPPQ